MIRSRDIVFHENQTIKDIEKPTMSQIPESSAQEDISSSTPAQFATGNNLVPEEIPEAEEEEKNRVLSRGSHNLLHQKM